MASYHSLLLMDAKLLFAQTHSSELQLVLYRQILRLHNKLSKLSFRICLNSQIFSIRKASSNGFAYV